MTETFQLAQLNVAKARFDLDDPRFQTFLDLLDPINATADRMPGFVWRMRDETEGATAPVRAFDDPRMIVNITVWQSIAHLHHFIFKTVHFKAMSRKREWFDALEKQHIALWWVPAGHIPTEGEAGERLAHLQANGPSAGVFDFSQLYDPHGQQTEIVTPA